MKQWDIEYKDRTLFMLTFQERRNLRRDICYDTLSSLWTSKREINQFDKKIWVTYITCWPCQQKKGCYIKDVLETTKTNEYITWWNIFEINNIKVNLINLRGYLWTNKNISLYSILSSHIFAFKRLITKQTLHSPLSKINTNFITKFFPTLIIKDNDL